MRDGQGGSRSTETKRLAAKSWSADVYRALLDSMTEGVSLATEQGMIVYTNPAEDRMFGYEALRPPSALADVPVLVKPVSKNDLEQAIERSRRADAAQI